MVWWSVWRQCRAGDVQPDPDKVTVDSLMAMRFILDRAASIDEAVAVLQQYNIDWGGGPLSSLPHGRSIGDSRAC